MWLGGDLGIHRKFALLQRAANRAAEPNHSSAAAQLVPYRIEPGKKRLPLVLFMTTCWLGRWVKYNRVLTQGAVSLQVIRAHFLVCC